jgi:predicted RNA-binding protein with TRAM domain
VVNAHVEIGENFFHWRGIQEIMSYGGGGRGYGSGGGGYGNRGFGRDSSGPKPVEVGKEYDVEITEISRRGDGIAKIGGFVIFVAGAKAGAKVRIKVTSVGPRFASAQIVVP